MTDRIVFVKTGHHYDSYIDFFKLAELSGFEIIALSDVDVSEDCVYIVSPHNGEWNPHISNQNNKPRLAHLILWCLERPNSKGTVGQYAIANRDLMYQRMVDEIWVSDRQLAKETSLRYVELGSHLGLGEPSDEKHYDFCHMSYINPRRETVLKWFDKKQIGPNCWPPERHEILQQSKFAFNIHQDDWPFQEPLRFALFAAYGLPIISETIADSWPLSEEYLIYSGYEGLPGKMVQVLNEGNYEKYKRRGLKLRQRLCEKFEFGKMVRKAVNETVSWR